MCVHCSCLTLCNPMDCRCHPLSMEFSRQEYWTGLPFPSPGDLPDPGIEPESPALQADSLLSQQPGKPSIIYGRCISDFTRNCPTFSQILYYCTFPLVVCAVLISLHPSQYLVW